MQWVSVEEDIVANEQARFVGQPTKLGTVLARFIVIASVFAMSSQCEAGEPLIGIYWTIAVPVMAVLIVWIVMAEFDVLAESLRAGWYKLTEKEDPLLPLYRV